MSLLRIAGKRHALAPLWKNGGPCGDRTHDTRIKSPVLCRAELTAHSGGGNPSGNPDEANPQRPTSSYNIPAQNCSTINPRRHNPNLSDWRQLSRRRTGGDSGGKRRAGLRPRRRCATLRLPYSAADGGPEVDNELHA